MLSGLIGGTLFAGMASEGFDRLSQPHFLTVGTSPARPTPNCGSARSP